MKSLRKRIRRGGVFVMLCILVISCMPVYAGEGKQEIVLFHHHSERCMGEVTVEKEADGDRNLETIGESVCSRCGGVVHEYRYRAVCSCGKSWESGGYACVHSSYGSEPAGCPVCSPVNFDTLHEHVEKRRICNKEETDGIGKIHLTISETEPAREVVLKAEYEGEIEQPDFSWEMVASVAEQEVKPEETPEETRPVKLSSITVKDNGTYKLISTYSEDGISYNVSHEIVIANIDREGPVLSQITYNDKPTNQPVELTVTAEDKSGLAKEPYSLDGENFQAENTFTITKNGTYTVMVLDRLGNVSEQNVEVSNLDFSPPQIQFQANPKIWEEGECVVSVQAKDTGLGLAKNAYSFDGGKTWGNNKSVTLKNSGTVTVLVRDAAGNISKASHKAVLDDTRIKEEEQRKIEEARKAEQERIEKEKAEQERIEREKAEQERIEKEKAEQERIERERAEQERIEREKAEQERIEREKAEQERIEREKAEQEKIEREKAEQERIEKERAERERIEKERAERERIEKERAERERIEKERAEQERIEKEKAERERIEKEKAEWERIEREKQKEEMKNKGKKNPGNLLQVLKGRMASFRSGISNLKEAFLKIPGEIRIITVSATSLIGSLFVGFGIFTLTKTAGVFWLDDAGKAHFMGRSYIRRVGDRFEIRLGTKDLRKAERPELVIRIPGPVFGLHQYKPLTVYYGENMISQHVEKRVKLTLR